MKLGDRVKVEIPEFVGKYGTSPAENFEGVLTGINVPCAVALGLLGHEVKTDDGGTAHVDPAWVKPL